MRHLFAAAFVVLGVTATRADRFGIDEASDSPVSLWGSVLWIAVLVLGYILFRKK
jgi:hypothetical protein